MKFKFIFILFNIIILIFLLFMSVFPVFILGRDFATSFWGISWPLAILLVILLAGLNLFFFINRELFRLLEREDWPALAQYLEERVLSRGRYSRQLVKLLANTYLVLSDPFSVLKLEKKLALAKPGLVDANSLTFGIARILSGDTRGAAEYFSQRVNMSKNEQPEWTGWYLGFASLLSEEYETAANSFLIRVNESRNPMIIGLSAYFLSDKLQKSLEGRAKECQDGAELGRLRIRKYLPTVNSWDKELQRAQNSVHIAVISKYLNQAGLWLYK